MLFAPGTQYRAFFRRSFDSGNVMQVFTTCEDAEACLDYWQRTNVGTVGHIESQTLSEWRKVDEAPVEVRAELAIPEDANNLFVNMADILQLIVSKWETERNLTDTMALAKAAVARAHRIRAEHTNKAGATDEADRGSTSVAGEVRGG